MAAGCSPVFNGGGPGNPVAVEVVLICNLTVRSLLFFNELAFKVKLAADLQLPVGTTDEIAVGVILKTLCLILIGVG